MRYGRVAEAAYHDFCDRHGYLLVSADGARDPAGRWGWAWWADPDRYRSGRGDGLATSFDAEATAAAVAIEDHRGEAVALGMDNRCVGRIVAGEEPPAGVAGRDTTRRLEAALADRGTGAAVVWLPFSADSGSRRHQRCDALARAALERP